MEQTEEENSGNHQTRSVHGGSGDWELLSRMLLM